MFSFSLFSWCYSYPVRVQFIYFFLDYFAIILVYLFHTLVTTSFFNKKLKNVSCEYDRWVVETQLCKLRDTSDTLIGRACAMFQLKYGVCELHVYDMVADT